MTLLIQSRLLKRAKAYGALAKLMEDANQVRILLEEAGEDPREHLANLLDDDDESAGANGARAIITPPLDPQRPEWAEPTWIWVPMDAMAPMGMVLALLQKSGGPLTQRALIDEMTRLGFEVNGGSVANIGTKLDSQNKITRTEDGWALRGAQATPLLDGREHAWGPAEVFTRQEVAAHRRLLVLHILRAHPSGLLQSQILSIMEGCEWVHAPFNKDLIKGDIEAMADERRVRRVGPTAKWEAVP